MTTASETSSELPDVELIERDDFELEPMSTDQAEEKRAAIDPRVLALVAVAAIMLAVAIMSRPGSGPSPQVPTQTTREVAPTTSAPAPDPALDSATSSPRNTQPIPLFGTNAPPEIPGVLSAVDSAGSLVVIDRSKLRAKENRLDMVIVEADPAAMLAVTGAPAVKVARDLSISGTRIVVSHDDRFLEPSFELSDIAADPNGTALLVEYGGRGQTATLAPIGWDGTDESELIHWELEGQSLEVLGAWQDQLVVQRADRVWTLDASLQETFVADGEVLSYDGVHLVRLRCEQVDACQIVVGSIDQPEARLVDLPETLRPLAQEAWTSSLAVSPDGTRLGASVRFGGLSLPVVVDLDSGESISLSDGMNHQAPVVWSPDGEWLAYAFTDDVMVWNLEAGRSWRIAVNREMVSLHWQPDAEPVG